MTTAAKTRAQDPQQRREQEAARRARMAAVYQEKGVQLDEFLSHFEDLSEGRENTWRAKCPCTGHKRANPFGTDLRISVGSTGKIRPKCSTGCPNEDVLQAVGLTPKALDLYADDETDRTATPNTKSEVAPLPTQTRSAAGTVCCRPTTHTTRRPCP
jgi:hypothetical protein